MPTLSEMLNRAAPSSPQQSIGEADAKPAIQTPAPSAVVAAKPAGLLRLGGKPVESVAHPATGAAQDSEPSKLPEIPSSGPLNLTALATMTSAAVPNLIDTRPMDHINPSAPDRELPADMTDIQKGFVKTLDSMYMVFDDAELFIGAVQRIMGEMKSARHLKNLLADEDSNLIIRGVRASAGMAQVKKVEAKEKRASGKSAKTSKIDPALLGSIKALAGFGGFDD